MGLMSNSDMEKAVEFVKKKYLGCSNCGALRVDIHDIIGLPLLERLMPSGIARGKQSIAALPLICSSCGSMTFFAAKSLMQLE